MATKPTISQNITTRNRTSGNSGRKYIVIHNVGTAATANGAAYNNTVYFKSTYRGASAHYFVDEGSIWQCVDLDDTAWHCGTSGTYYSECRNSTSIGIELCGNSTFPDAEIELAAQLVQWLMDEYDIDEDHVIRHYDVTHKSCPAAYLTDSKWSALKAVLVGSSSGSSSSSSSSSSSTSVSYKVKVTASAGLNVRSGAGTSYSKVTAIPYGKTVTITKESNGWGYTTYNSKSGWICLTYTSKVSTTSTSTTSTSSYQVKVTASAGLNMRKGAGTSYSKVTAVPYGKTLTITKVSGNWGYTTYNSKSGWVCLTYTSKTSSYKVKVTASAGLNVRKGAGTSYSKVTAIPYGKTVTITKTSGGWGYTTYNSKSGWIYLTYTSKVSS